MNNQATLTIGDMVSENIKYSHVFKKYGIDFCCGGGVTIQKACQKGNIDIEKLMADLKSVEENVLPSQNYNNWSMDFLCDHIINTHHQYVREGLSLLKVYGEKVAKVHGDKAPELIRIHQLIEILAAELISHMHKEEQILFPFIKSMVDAGRHDRKLPTPPFGSIDHPIHMMEDEHEVAGDILKEISSISNKFTPPIWACNTYKALFSKLDEFEQDLHIHIHLENNILFPKAKMLEQKLK
ncbi:MAG: iron-sulfur cluster repair di-iron protein [Saprospiraceae bacterium]